jgi:hypothetical protein
MPLHIDDERADELAALLDVLLRASPYLPGTGAISHQVVHRYPRLVSGQG